MCFCFLFVDGLCSLASCMLCVLSAFLCLLAFCAFRVFDIVLVFCVTRFICLWSVLTGSGVSRIFCMRTLVYFEFSVAEYVCMFKFIRELRAFGCIVCIGYFMRFEHFAYSDSVLFCIALYALCILL